MCANYLHVHSTLHFFMFIIFVMKNWEKKIHFEGTSCNGTDSVHIFTYSPSRKHQKGINLKGIKIKGQRVGQQTRAIKFRYQKKQVSER